MVATRCRIVCAEKPGVENASAWAALCADFPETRFMMTKNNQWRDNIDELKELYATAKTVNFNWINHNRVPNAGTWFTTRKLAYGGVSRDLLPHLLSLYIAVDDKWQDTKWEVKQAKQGWELNDLTTTDYGTVKADGIYDVDDYVRLSAGKTQFTADWKGDAGDDIGIHFDGTFIELGLCPESAYKSMMKTAMNNVDIDLFWKDQYRQDMWIHATIAV
jgi:predicted dehydrogenase